MLSALLNEAKLFNLIELLGLDGYVLQSVTRLVVINQTVKPVDHASLAVITIINSTISVCVFKC